MVDNYEFFIDIFKAMKSIQQKMDSGFRLHVKWDEKQLGYIASLRKDVVIKSKTTIARMVHESEYDCHIGGTSSTLVGCLLSLFHCFMD